jgi:Transglutaminase-like superfamily
MTPFHTKLHTKLAKLHALSWSERRTLVAAMAWMPLFWLGLHGLGLRRFQAWLLRPRLLIQNDLSLDEIMGMATAVNRAARLVRIPANCLTRSLLLGWLLRRRGVACQLRIGVQMNNGSLAAHAWVEYAGIPINDQPNVGEQFAAFQPL